MDIFLRGFIIGFSIAAPVGPIGVLCIRRTLAKGRLRGFLSGLGAATADAFYGAIAALGLTAISGTLLSFQMWIKLLGGLFLLYLAIQTFRARPAQEAVAVQPGGLFRAYFSTVFLTLTNPATILSFAAVFAGLGLAQTNGGFASAGQVVLGVFLGSSAWWLTLSLGVGIFRERFNSEALGWVNRISGVVIAAFGLVALVSLFA
jgi:threonine/homoserine/homoserine lactone efflux protein